MSDEELGYQMQVMKNAFVYYAVTAQPKAKKKYVLSVGL